MPESAGSAPSHWSPQPFVTVAQSKNSQIRIAIDLGAEWEAVNPQSKLIAGVTIISSKLISDSPDAVTALLSHYKDSVAFAVDHPDDAATLVGKYGIVPEPIAKVALPKCSSLIWMINRKCNRVFVVRKQRCYRIWRI